MQGGLGILIMKWSLILLLDLSLLLLLLWILLHQEMLSIFLLWYIRLGYWLVGEKLVDPATARLEVGHGANELGHLHASLLKQLLHRRLHHLMLLLGCGRWIECAQLLLPVTHLERSVLYITSKTHTLSRPE